MKTIRLAPSTHQALAELAILPFRSTATEHPDGTLSVPVSDETWDHLQGHRLAGESDDDLVQRIIRDHRGQRPH